MNIASLLSNSNLEGNDINNSKQIFKIFKLLERERENVFVCIYNDNTEVSLFERKTIKCSNSSIYDEADIYTEIDGNLLGMLGRKKRIGTVGLSRQGGLWIGEGQSILSEEGETYTSNCQLNRSIYFSDLYYKLTGFHGPVELTTDKIEKVLGYVYTYYDIERPKEKIKK